MLKFYREQTINRFNLKENSDVVKVMGGIVGDANFEEFKDVAIKDNPQYNQMKFSLKTDKYSLNRIFDFDNKEVIENSLFRKSTQETLYAASILNNQINHASKLGFKQLTCYAAKEGAMGGEAYHFNGYYTWLMMGYIPQLNTGFEEKLNIVFKQHRFSGVSNYVQLLKTEKGRNFWKQYGFAFEGVFDLSEDSPSRKIFDNYLKTRDIMKSQEAPHPDDAIFADITDEDLANAYKSMQEHNDWKEAQKEEKHKQLEKMLAGEIPLDTSMYGRAYNNDEDFGKFRE